MQLQIETSNSGSRTVMNKKSVQLGGLYTRSDKYVQTVGFQTAAVRVEQCLVVYSTEEEIEMKSRDRWSVGIVWLISYHWNQIYIDRRKETCIYMYVDEIHTNSYLIVTLVGRFDYIEMTVI